MVSEEKEPVVDWYRIITVMEKTLLVVIAFLTTYAVVVEIFVVVSERAVKLTDLLSRINEEKKIERNRNLALSVAAVSAVTVFGIILTL